MDENVFNKESGYDQKAFLQIRLHNLIGTYDKASLVPLEKDLQSGLYGYQIMANTLTTIYLTISSKLNKDEKDKALIYRNYLTELIKKSIFFSEQGKKGIYWNNWSELNDHLFFFRRLLEDCMDKHGFNPSKEDPSQAILKF